mgnify:CR=1 FL=1
MSRVLTPHPPPVSPCLCAIPLAVPTKSKQVMDDFVRNFMVRMGLTGTLEKFETEWYEMEATGKLNKEDMGAVPDVYNYNQELNDQCVALRREVNACMEKAAEAMLGGFAAEAKAKAEEEGGATPAGDTLWHLADRRNARTSMKNFMLSQLKWSHRELHDALVVAGLDVPLRPSLINYFNFMISFLIFFIYSFG